MRPSAGRGESPKYQQGSLEKGNNDRKNLSPHQLSHLSRLDGSTYNFDIFDRILNGLLILPE